MPKYESWAMGAAVRKATRQTPVDDAPRTRGVPNKRDTKRWCRGKVGVEHKLAVKTYRELKGTGGMAFQGWLVRYCSGCGKEIEQFVPPWRGSASSKPIPKWAEEYFEAHPDERPLR